MCTASSGESLDFAQRLSVPASSHPGLRFDRGLSLVQSLNVHDHEPDGKWGQLSSMFYGQRLAMSKVSEQGWSGHGT